jgi:3-hydroxy acid dehydrogenase / malonic semialdehyde reductase
LQQPSQARDAATQDDRVMCGEMGGRKRRVLHFIHSLRICSQQNAPLPSPLTLPLDPVILSELVPSLRGTSETKDLLVDAGNGIRIKGKNKSMNQPPRSGNKMPFRLSFEGGHCFNANISYFYINYNPGSMNKIIMITGATSGFGKAIAIQFARNGYDIIITGRRKERLEGLEKELLLGKIKVLSLNFDVRKQAEVDSVINNLPAEWKTIDILVNNAGLAVGLSHIDSGIVEDWERMIDTNVKGLLYVTRAVSPLMVARNSGYIFNISSIAGSQIYENGNVYCASKSAVDALSKSMRIDLLKNNIRVTNIAPGMANTEFSTVRFKGDKEKADAVYKGFDFLTGDDIADVIFYCASLPSHVCINELVITPTQQANAFYSNRKEK